MFRDADEEMPAVFGMTALRFSLVKKLLCLKCPDSHIPAFNARSGSAPIRRRPKPASDRR